VRNLFVALAVVMATTSTWSPARAAPVGAEVHTDEIDHLLKSGRRIRVAGQVLVGLGCVDAILATVLGPVGIWAGTVGPTETTPGMIPRGSDVSTLEAAALGLSVAAAALIAVGIPLMAEGDARLERAHKLVGKSSIRVAATPGGVGLAW
jgi:hypothetical protein